MRADAARYFSISLLTHADATCKVLDDIREAFIEFAAMLDAHQS